MSHLHPTQVEQLRAIAATLSQKRQELKISLEEVTVKTHVRLQLLKALEQLEIEQLPEPVFIQGFIRRYADCLGLDGTAMAQTFRTDVEPPRVAEPNAVLRSATEPQKPRRSSSSPSLLYPIAGIAGLCIVVGMGFWVVQALSSKPAKRPQQATQTQPQVATPKPAAQSPAPPAQTSSPTPPKTSVTPTPAIAAQPQPTAQAASPSPTPQATPAPEVLQLSVNLTGKSWMEVVVDGNTIFEGMLEPGTQRTWQGKQKITLRAGNAGAVMAAFNQAAAKPFGKPGEVKEVTVSKNSRSQ